MHVLEENKKPCKKSKKWIREVIYYFFSLKEERKYEAWETATIYVSISFLFTCFCKAEKRYIRFFCLKEWLCHKSTCQEHVQRDPSKCVLPSPYKRNNMKK